jgi:hypothetical protein
MAGGAVFDMQNGRNQAFDHGRHVVGAGLSGYLGWNFGPALFWLAALLGKLGGPGTFLGNVPLNIFAQPLISLGLGCFKLKTGPQHPGSSMKQQSSALLLLVEDDELVRPNLKDTLTEGGFELKLARNGVEALSLLEAHKDTIRGLITDINLGTGPDGWDVARHARELTPSLPWSI